ncbi:MAG: hypothetical protein HUU15_06645 [Candidatus Brocadiae bacterium]|nr:hypothetical protein [Candidatus Brocadiia bacterium]
MIIRVWCERDRCLGSAFLSGHEPQRPCPGCGDPLKITLPPTGETLDACWNCGCPNLYVEKAFPQVLGCGVIVVSAGLAIAFAQKTWGLSFLGIIVLDFVLYFLIPMRTVCYKCCAEYTGAPKNDRQKGYDLLIAGKYADTDDVGGPAGH